MQYSWYHGYITPAQSNQLLQGQKEKSFLLRASRVRVQEKIFSFVGKGGKIRHMKVIDDGRNDFMKSFNLHTTAEAVEKMCELYKDLDYPVNREENQVPANMEIIQFDSLVCSICELQFDSEKKLTNHKNSHIVKFCRNCHEFFQANNGQRHKDYCNNTKFPCQTCNMSFNSRSNLHSHVKLQGKCKLTFSCDLCDNRFSSQELVASHKTRVHKLRIKCDFCPKVMSTMEYKSQHEKLIHKKITERQKPLYECDICKKPFVKPSNLKIHRRVHNEQYVCGSCEHVCSSKPLLRQHETEHHSKPKHIIFI